MLKTDWRNLGLALLLGAGFPLGFAPYGWWPLSLLSAAGLFVLLHVCLLNTSPSPRDVEESRMPSSA